MFRARGPKNSGGLLAELALDQLKGKDESRRHVCMLRLIRGELRIYGPHDTSIDGRPEETICLTNARGSKPLLGIEMFSPCGFQLRVACGGTGGAYAADERVLKFEAQREDDAVTFFKALETEWERVYPLTPSKIAKRNAEILSPARMAKLEGRKFNKDFVFDGTTTLGSMVTDAFPEVTVGPRTVKLFCGKLRTFLVWACENGGVSALGEGEIGPTDRPPLRCDHVHIDFFHKKLCVACEPGTPCDARILAVAAQVYYDLAGYQKDSKPRAQDLLQRLALGALLMCVAEVGATLRSLGLWLAATGKWGRLCSICEELLGLTPREALAVTALSTPVSKDFQALCKRLQSFTRSQIGSNVSPRMWSERTIRAAVVVFAPGPVANANSSKTVQETAVEEGEKTSRGLANYLEKTRVKNQSNLENPFFLAEASELGTQLRRRLIFDEALVDPRVTGATTKMAVCITGLSALKEDKSPARDNNEKEKKALFKFKERLEESNLDQLRGTRACLRHLLPDVKVVIDPGKASQDWVKAEDKEHDEDEDKDDEGTKNTVRDKEEKGANTKVEDKENNPELRNSLTARSINAEDMVAWVVEFLSQAKKKKEKSVAVGAHPGKMGLLSAEAVPPSPEVPTVVASLTEAVRQASIGKVDDDEGDGTEDENDEKGDEEKTEEQKTEKKRKAERKKLKEQQAKETKENLTNPPAWILFEVHETQAHVFELRVFWKPPEDKSAGKGERRATKTGLEAEEDWKLYVVRLENFAELAASLWEEHAHAARKRREEEERKKAEEEANRKKEEEAAKRKEAAGARPSATPGARPSAKPGAVRGSMRPSAKPGVVRGSRLGAPGSGAGSAKDDTPKKASPRGSFRPGAPGGGIEKKASVKPDGGTEKKGSMRPDGGTEKKGSVRPGARASRASDRPGST